MANPDAIPVKDILLGYLVVTLGVAVWIILVYYAAATLINYIFG
jgi:hypothetical protein